MQHIHLHLQDWQQTALAEMAHSRGIALETMAESLLNERLMERLSASSVRWPVEFCPLASLPAADTLEARLKRLFDE